MVFTSLGAVATTSTEAKPAERCAHRGVPPGGGSGQQGDLEQRAGVPAIQDARAQRARLPPVVGALCYIPHRPQLAGGVVLRALVYGAQPAGGTATEN
jgi:hypothetical protein